MKSCRVSPEIGCPEASTTEPSNCWYPGLLAKSAGGASGDLPKPAKGDGLAAAWAGCDSHIACRLLAHPTKNGAIAAARSEITIARTDSPLHCLNLAGAALRSDARARPG